MSMLNYKEKSYEVNTLFLSHLMSWEYTEHSKFIVGVDVGPVTNRGNVEISLEGMSIRFEYDDIIHRKSDAIGCFKRNNYFEVSKDATRLSKNTLPTPAISNQAMEAKNHNYNLERVELEALVSDILAWLVTDINGDWLSADEIFEKMKSWRREDLAQLLHEITDLYNSFINDGNRNINREDRGKEIRSNLEFKIKLGSLCGKFLLKGELNAVLSISAFNAVLIKQFDEFKDIIEFIEDAIILREDYQNIPDVFINKNKKYAKEDKEYARKELENIKEIFKKVKDDYKRLEEMKEQVIKNTCSIEEYEKALEEFKKSSMECLNRLHKLEHSRHNLERPIREMISNNRGLASKGQVNWTNPNSTKNSYFDHLHLKGSLDLKIHTFQAFLIGFDGLKPQLSKAEIQKEEEERAPLIKNLKKNKSYYNKSLSWLLIENIARWEVIKNQDGFGFATVEGMFENSEDILRTRDSLFTTMYLKGTSFEGCSPEELEVYKKFISYIGMINGIKGQLNKIHSVESQIAKELEKSESTKIEELLTTLDYPTKAFLYDKFMAETYKYEVKNVSTEVDKVKVFEKALKKKVSGGGFLQNVINPISAFNDIDTLYRGYIEYKNPKEITEKEMAEKILSVLKEASMYMGVIDNTEAQKKIIRKMTNEVEEIAGYYSDEFTEDAASSRFNAMNKR